MRVNSVESYVVLTRIIVPSLNLSSVKLCQVPSPVKYLQAKSSVNYLQALSSTCRLRVDSHYQRAPCLNSVRVDSRWGEPQHNSKPAPGSPTSTSRGVCHRARGARGARDGPPSELEGKLWAPEPRLYGLAGPCYINLQNAPVSQAATAAPAAVGTGPPRAWERGRVFTHTHTHTHTHPRARLGRQFRHIPPEMRRRVKTALSTGWRRSGCAFAEVMVVDELPAQLRTEVRGFESLCKLRYTINAPSRVLCSPVSGGQGGR